MLTCLAIRGIGEVSAGDDLTALLLDATDLHDGDILVVTSKVVSKAEGRVLTGDRAELVARETRRVVARRGPTTIARTRHGLVMAAAGIDASNTARGTVVLLPTDPDGSARGLREDIHARTGVNVAVVVSDTSGRAWRTGQTDIAVGAAGLEVLDDHAGRDDGYGNLLAVTAPALADEVAAAADLVTGKLSRCPAALVRGLSRLVLPPGQDGRGAVALVRPEAEDMFGLGTREAALQALVREEPAVFGAPAPAGEVLTAMSLVVPEAAAAVSADGRLVEVTLPSASEVGEGRLGALAERATAAAFSLGWQTASATCGEEDRRTALRFCATSQ